MVRQNPNVTRLMERLDATMEVLDGKIQEGMARSNANYLSFFDETPPRFIGSTPAAGALNNERTKISLMFDEFIKLEKATEKVVVSPPQIQQPEIKASGKRIQVNLLDSLKPNTTYTIDFSDAIVDNNEGNPLGNFAFTFSTGTEIDTMEVAGTMLDASNLEPIKGMLVGLHSNLNDSAFNKLPFDRVARTDSRGRFSIRGVAPGKYRIYGLMDADQNFTFNQKSEMIAFHDSLIIPRMEERIRMDTAWVDSLTYDTIVEKKYMHYLPDDVILRAFKELNYSQYLIKSERLVPHKFTFYFAGKADTLPVLKGLNFDEKDAFVIEKNQRNDTIHYWVKDSLLFKQDTLAMSLTYLYTDTLNQYFRHRVQTDQPVELRPEQKSEAITSGNMPVSRTMAGGFCMIRMTM